MCLNHEVMICDYPQSSASFSHMSTHLPWDSLVILCLSLLSLLFKSDSVVILALVLIHFTLYILFVCENVNMYLLIFSIPRTVNYAYILQKK